MNPDDKLAKDIQEGIKALRKKYKINRIIVSEEDFNDNFKKTISTYYVCPFCGEYNGNMKLSAEKHIITKQEIESDPHIIDLGIGHEILLCPCGKQLTWFELEERIDK